MKKIIPFWSIGYMFGLWIVGQFNPLGMASLMKDWERAIRRRAKMFKLK